MSSTTPAPARHARNASAYAYGYNRAKQMLDGPDRAELRGYLRTWQARLLRTPFGSKAYAVALGAWTYLNERLNTGPCHRPLRARGNTHRYSMRGNDW